MRNQIRRAITIAAYVHSLPEGKLTCYSELSDVLGTQRTACVIAVRFLRSIGVVESLKGGHGGIRALGNARDHKLDKFMAAGPDSMTYDTSEVSHEYKDAITRLISCLSLEDVMDEFTAVESEDVL